MTPHDRIPATVVTGFLGAGKTTLIRNLIENAAGKRIALIVNEFGDMGFDGDLVADCEDPTCAPDSVVELTNGCICCTVADDFLPTMEMLLQSDNKPDHIVIETSGLALPQPLIKAFNWPSVKTQVTVDGVVTVVDSAAVADGQVAHDMHAVQAQREADEALDHESPIEELFEDQLIAADMIVLNKTDLVDQAALEKVKQRVSEDIRGGVQMLSAKNGLVDSAILLGLDAAAEDDMAARPSHHDHEEDDHDHDDFESFVATAGSFASVDAARSSIESAMRDFSILRMKGAVVIDGKAAPLMIQAVGPRVESWFSTKATDKTPSLVVIGEKGLQQTKILQHLSLSEG